MCINIEKQGTLAIYADSIKGTKALIFLKQSSSMVDKLFKTLNNLQVKTLEPYTKFRGSEKSTRGMGMHVLIFS